MGFDLERAAARLDIVTGGGDNRIIRETGVDARVAAIVEPLLGPLGFRLVRVRLSGQNGATLQIMAERFDRSMTVEDCEQLSRMISPVLDVEDPIDQAYDLEVSSPGIDRPLVRASDFACWWGHLAKLETSILLDGRKRFRGKIAGVSDDTIMIERDVADHDDESTVQIPFDAIAGARLILTDDLIQDALKQDRKLRQRRKRNRRGGGKSADKAEQET